MTAQHSIPVPRATSLKDSRLLGPVWLGVVGPQGVLVMPLIVGSLAERLHLGPAAAGFEASAALSGACVAGVALSLFVRAVAWRHLALMFITCLCVAYGTLAMQPTHVVSLAAMFLAGLGMGGQLALGMTASTDSRVQPQAMGLMFGGQGAVAALLAALISRLAHSGSGTLLFVMLAVVSAAGLLAIPVLANRSVAAPALERLAATGRRLSWPLLCLALVAWGGYNFASGGFWPLVERIAVADGQSMASAAGAISLALTVGIFGGLAAIVIGNRFGRVVPLLFVGAVTVGAILSMVAHPAPSGFATSLCAFVFVWSLGPSYQLPVVADEDASGRSMPLALLAMKICMAVAPAAFGMLVGHGDYARAGLLAAVVAATSSAILIVLAYRQR